MNGSNSTANKQDGTNTSKNEKPSDRQSRRGLLRKGGLAVAAVTTSALAGCAVGGTGTDPPTTTTVATPTDSPTETASPTSTPRDLEPLDPRIRDHGHYSWFALSQQHWGRQETPYNLSDGSSRWLAQPTDDGGIRLLVKEIDSAPFSYQNAGFDLHLGRLGDISRIEILSESIQSGQFDPELVLGLFLDEDENGEFFVWQDGDGQRDEWDTLGGDEVAIVANLTKVGDSIVIDDDTQLQMANRNAAVSTLGQLKRGKIEYPNSHGDETRSSGEDRGIDADTETALYVGLADNGDGSAVEAIVRGVVIE